MSSYDIHAHLLPGVDDGPRDLEETVAALRVAYDGGVRGVVATSHIYSPIFPTSVAQLREVFERTLERLEALARERSDCAFLSELELSLGAENYLSTELILALDSDQVLSLGGGGSLLLEVSPYLTFDVLSSALARVLEAGYTPVLAHVERYRMFHRDPGRLAEAVAMGCHAQINADSVLGGMSSPVRRRALEFLKSGVASVVASDMHDAGRRPSRLGEAERVLRRRFGAERAAEWLADNPRRLVGAPRGAP